MPDESEKHLCTWMAFGANETVWGDRLLPEVQRNLALIARTIAKYEPVNMLVNASDMARARKLVGQQVNLIACPINDLWARDTAPVFVTDGAGNTSAIDFNFNGWGRKQVHALDASVARFIAHQAKIPRIQSELVLEGGGIEVDGQGTAIVTESCVLNANRNPGISKADCEAVLKTLLGLEKIIWLPGIKGKDITDGHTDFYARFTREGTVLAGFDPDPNSYDHAVTQRHLAILRQSTDAKGRALKVTVMQAPTDFQSPFESKEFAAGYIGFYVCNRAVIMQGFGDEQADHRAKTILQNAYPTRVIEQIRIDGIAAGGGSIHCTTQQQPAA